MEIESAVVASNKKLSATKIILEHHVPIFVKLLLTSRFPKQHHDLKDFFSTQSGAALILVVLSMPVEI